MFRKILIANRGEIAVRVIRSAKEAGIKTVAVFSDADKEAMHVKMADEAVYIGKSPANESYLVQEKIIKAALDTGAEAIHPGYGFLSENASFSELCKQNNIEFIGPPADAIRTMGDKITARKTMIAAGVPVVPGLEDFTGNDDELIAFAQQVGFPVMVKASAGGGGKGMRLVHSADELIDAVKMAKGEAKSAFGDDTVYIEKFISSPHHIEFQILADKYGNVIHINERECSVQRRHQKVIEETPSPLNTRSP
jgi:acetyl-CoA carboxylase biotin carboxylase subunit